MNSKKGTSGWTVEKLLTIILLVIVMALVIYGLTTGQLKPLIERVGGMADGMQNTIYDLFGWNIEGVDDETCYDLGDGINWEVGEPPLKGELCLGKNYCKVNLKSLIYTSPMAYPGSSSFSLSNSVLRYWNSVDGEGGWAGLGDFNLGSDISLAVLEREIYQALSEYSRYFSEITSHPELKGVWFRVDELGKDTYYRRDYGGKWYSNSIGDTDNSEKSWDDEKALKEIYSNSNDFIGKDEVYWKFSNDEGSEKIIPGMTKIEGVIKVEKDFEIFKKFFYEKLNIINLDAENKIKKSREELADKKVSLNGNEYLIQEGRFENKEIFFIEGDFGKYGIRYNVEKNDFSLLVYSSEGWVLAKTSHSFIEDEGESRAEAKMKLSAIYKFLMGDSRC